MRMKSSFDDEVRASSDEVLACGESDALSRDYEVGDAVEGYCLVWLGEVMLRDAV